MLVQQILKSKADDGVVTIAPDERLAAAAKLLAATLILGLGALNMTRVTHQLAAEPARGRATLRITLRLDAVLFTLILGIIAAATTISGPME